nr:hypothetical protein [Tanacetum cinerariifolium]
MGGGENGKSSKQTRFSKRLQGEANEVQSRNEETNEHVVQSTELDSNNAITTELDTHIPAEVPMLNTHVRMLIPNSVPTCWATDIQGDNEKRSETNDGTKDDGNLIDQDVIPLMVKESTRKETHRISFANVLTTELPNNQVNFRTLEIHDVPMAAFTVDGLSAIDTKLGKPIMMDSYTTSMCNESWGRSSYARVMIEIQLDRERKESMTIAMHNLEDDGVTKEMITFEYECSKVCQQIHDQINEPSSSKLVPKVVPSAVTTTLSKQELDLLFGPLYDEFFTTGTSCVNKSSSPTDNSKQQDTPPLATA